MTAYITAYSVILALITAAVVSLCVIYVRVKVGRAEEKSKGAVVADDGLFADIFGKSGNTAFLILRADTREPVYISVNAAEFFGMTAQAASADIEAVKNHIDKKFVRAFERKYAEWDGSGVFETEFDYGDGKHAKCDAFTAEHDGIKYVAFSISDITAQKRELCDMGEQLDAALEQAAVKSSFLSSMSHEIRTPMNGVMGMMSLAKMNIDNPEKAKSYLDRAGDLSVFLLGMINDILDISKIESGKMKLFNTQIDVFAFAEKIRNMFNGTLTGKGLTFSVETVDVAARYLMGDEMRLTQVITNLVSNAGKFTPVGGRIDVTFKQLDLIGGKSQLMIRVRDTGKGIAPENIRKIMRPFEQEEASTAHNYGGTGLGLAICDNIVRLMGGNIVIDSALGKGTDFSVFVALPIADIVQDITQPVALQPEEDDATEFEYDGCRILLAEDNEVNAEIAVELLESDGAKVTLAHDGREAADIFASSPDGAFDLLLLDIQMPRLNGRDAAREIRASGKADALSVPIIALSADAFNEDVKLSEAAGMDAHVSKPIDFDALRRRAGEIIRAKKKAEGAPSTGKTEQSDNSGNAGKSRKPKKPKKADGA